MAKKYKLTIEEVNEAILAELAGDGHTRKEVDKPNVVKRLLSRARIGRGEEPAEEEPIEHL